MDPIEVQKLLAEQPFKPFVAHYPSDKAIEVRSPDQALLTGDKRTLVVAKPASQDGGGFEMLDVIMIERIDQLPLDTQPRMWWISNNGH